MNLILRKCKSLSRQLGRSSSYSSLRSKSSRQEMGSSDQHHDAKNKNKNKNDDVLEDDQELICILVGSTRKRYLISSKHLRHPLVSALVEKPGGEASNNNNNNNNNNNFLVVKCEVVFFDHLLWMLDNADPINLGLDSLEELANLYML